jgi:2-polyprenyl-3-methyl-5-hydroxy-6-metoxy-1,4-benzoquinol methylase
MEHVPCNLCGADEPQEFLTLSDRFSGRQFRLVRCPRCSLIYLDPRPSMEELSSLYPEEYEAFQPPVAEMSSMQAWHASRMREMQANYVMRFVNEPGNLLDIGCATGEFLSTMQGHGWGVSGLEVIEQAAQTARERYNLQVITGTLETADLPDLAYDVITMWDVLEHLPDPSGALVRCRRLLKPGGVVIFSIPNLASFDRYLFGSRWIGWDAPRHFTLFSTHTLRQALQKAGFSFENQNCFLGGKGTFLLSLDNVLDKSRQAGLIKKMYPVISALLWPYRQLSYLVGRGPILAVAARRVEQA